ncbi:MAG: sigma-70 family RNA polymerase sigma factor [Odoribacteraceae bacterium]|jgi:RNA polymerase sigma-70 factor (ECF subfamily)|nr:sigma-70 family RNA polymerase sigma factor [Odoribacteraceae bacterium]
MEQDNILELIARGKGGDTRAFGQLVVLYQPLVYRLAFRLLCDDDDAKDVVQEVFIKAWTRLARYDDRYRFSTWVYKITCNECRDRLRSARRRAGRPGVPLALAGALVADPADVEAGIVNRELKELILYFTGKLSPRQKLVFTLVDLEGLDAGEVAAATGLSAGQVKSNLHLARKRIREKINALTS